MKDAAEAQQVLARQRQLGRTNWRRALAVRWGWVVDVSGAHRISAFLCVVVG